MASPFNDFVPYKNGVADSVAAYPSPTEFMAEFGPGEGSDDARPASPLEWLTYALMLLIFVGIFAFAAIVR